MFIDILSCILEFKEFIFLLVGVFLVSSCASLIMSSKVSWGSKNLKYIGLFVGLDKKEHILLSIIFIKYLFIISCVIFRTEIGIAQIIYYLLLFLLGNLIHFDVKVFLMDLVNSILILIALFVGNILNGYIFEVTSDIKIKIINTLLQANLILYAIYFFVKNIEHLILSRQTRRKNQNEN